MSPRKALLLTSLLAVIMVAGAFYVFYLFLPLILKAPFISLSAILVGCVAGLALIIGEGNKRKRREEERMKR